MPVSTKRSWEGHECDVSEAKSTLSEQFVLSTKIPSQAQRPGRLSTRPSGSDTSSESDAESPVIAGRRCGGGSTSDSESARESPRDIQTAAQGHQDDSDEVDSGRGRRPPSQRRSSPGSPSGVPVADQAEVRCGAVGQVPVPQQTAPTRSQMPTAIDAYFWGGASSESTGEPSSAVLAHEHDVTDMAKLLAAIARGDVSAEWALIAHLGRSEENAIAAIRAGALESAATAYVAALQDSETPDPALDFYRGWPANARRCRIFASVSLLACLMASADFCGPLARLSLVKALAHERGCSLADALSRFESKFAALEASGGDCFGDASPATALLGRSVSIATMQLAIHAFERGCNAELWARPGLLDKLLMLVRSSRDDGFGILSYTCLWLLRILCEHGVMADIGAVVPHAAVLVAVLRDASASLAMHSMAIGCLCFIMEHQMAVLKAGPAKTESRTCSISVAQAALAAQLAAEGPLALIVSNLFLTWRTSQRASRLLKCIVCGGAPAAQIIVLRAVASIIVGGETRTVVEAIGQEIAVAAAGQIIAASARHPNLDRAAAAVAAAVLMPAFVADTVPASVLQNASSAIAQLCSRATSTVSDLAVLLASPRVATRLAACSALFAVAGFVGMRDIVVAANTVEPLVSIADAFSKGLAIVAAEEAEPAMALLLRLAGSAAGRAQAIAAGMVEVAQAIEHGPGTPLTLRKQAKTMLHWLKHAFRSDRVSNTSSPSPGSPRPLHRASFSELSGADVGLSTGSPQAGLGAELAIVDLCSAFKLEFCVTSQWVQDADGRSMVLEAADLAGLVSGVACSDVAATWALITHLALDEAHVKDAMGAGALEAATAMHMRTLTRLPDPATDFYRTPANMLVCPFYASSSLLIHLLISTEHCGYLARLSLVKALARERGCSLADALSRFESKFAALEASGGDCFGDASPATALLGRSVSVAAMQLAIHAFERGCNAELWARPGLLDKLMTLVRSYIHDMSTAASFALATVRVMCEQAGPVDGCSASIHLPTLASILCDPTAPFMSQSGAAGAIGCILDAVRQAGLGAMRTLTFPATLSALSSAQSETRALLVRMLCAPQWWARARAARLLAALAMHAEATSADGHERQSTILGDVAAVIANEGATAPATARRAALQSASHVLQTVARSSLLSEPAAETAAGILLDLISGSAAGSAANDDVSRPDSETMTRYSMDLAASTLLALSNGSSTCAEAGASRLAALLDSPRPATRRTACKALFVAAGQIGMRDNIMAGAANISRQLVATLHAFASDPVQVDEGEAALAVALLLRLAGSAAGRASALAAGAIDAVANIEQLVGASPALRKSARAFINYSSSYRLLLSPAAAGGRSDRDSASTGSV